jgi:hypothetical protein
MNYVGGTVVKEIRNFSGQQINLILSKIKLAVGNNEQSNV